MSNERIDLTQFEGHTEGPWKAGIDCPEYFEMGEAHEENFHFSLHEFHAVIPGTDAWRGARDGEWENPNEWYGYSKRDPKQLRADVLLMAAGPDLIAELKRCYEEIDELKELCHEFLGQALTLYDVGNQHKDVNYDYREFNKLRTRFAELLDLNSASE